MNNITAGEVNKLRKATGAGIMDCKNALVESNGDFDLAIENLRTVSYTHLTLPTTPYV